MSPNTFYTLAYCCQVIAAISTLSFITDRLRTKKQKGCVFAIVIIFLFAGVYLSYEGKDMEVNDATKGSKQIIIELRDIKKSMLDGGLFYDSTNKKIERIDKSDNSVQMSNPTLNAPSQNGGNHNTQNNK